MHAVTKQNYMNLISAQKLTAKPGAPAYKLSADEFANRGADRGGSLSVQLHE